MHNTRYQCKFNERNALFPSASLPASQAPSEPLTPRSVRGIAPAWAIVATLCACGDNSLPDYRKGDTEPLRVVVRATPAAWYLDRGSAQGVDHDLLTLFAKTLDRKLEISQVPNTSDALAALCKKSQIELAVGLLNLPASMRDRFRISRNYDSVKQQLLYHFAQPGATDTGQLVMKQFEISNEPRHIEALLNIKQHNADLTRWTVHETSFPYELIAALDQGFIEYTVADSHAVTMTRRFHPRLKKAFEVGDELPLHWVFGDCASEELIAASEVFFDELKTNRKLAQILDRYYGHAEQLDYPEKLAFIEKVDRHLHRYRTLFIQAAEQSGIDWLLLAALSYQESHWRPQARSPSGVEGLMMVTLQIAQEFGIEDRRDPTQSIHAGTRFLLKLKEQLPSQLQEPDRSWFALAAYNAGLGYVKKAMATASQQGRDPLLWIEVRDFLRASDPQALNDPYVYVYNVRAYRDLLAWLEGMIRFAPFEEDPQHGVSPPLPLPM